MKSIKVVRVRAISHAEGRTRMSRRRGARPQHEAVSWDDTIVDGTITKVRVRCPKCGDVRYSDAKNVARQLRNESFTGLCRADALLGKVRVDSPPKPQFPGLDWDRVVPVGEGRRRRNLVAITCPDCGQTRLQHPTHVSLRVRAGAFDLRCLACRRARALCRRLTTGSNGRWGKPLGRSFRMVRSARFTGLARICGRTLDGDPHCFFEGCW